MGVTGRGCSKTVIPAMPLISPVLFLSYFTIGAFWSFTVELKFTGGSREAFCGQQHVSKG